MGYDDIMKNIEQMILSAYNGGCNMIDNLQFLTWFENRAKCDMSQEDWNKVKLNIKDYLI